MSRYIDADKFAERMMKIWDSAEEQNRTDIVRVFADIVTPLLVGTPTAEVTEAKRGRWELNDDGSGTCSRCNTTQKNVWDLDNYQNFCGHCGAKMDLGEEE